MGGFRSLALAIFGLPAPPWAARRSLRSRHTGRFFDGTVTRLRGAGRRGGCGGAPLRSEVASPLRGWGAPLRSCVTSPRSRSERSPSQRGGFAAPQPARSPDSAVTSPLRGRRAPLRGGVTSAPPPIRAGGLGSGSRASARAPTLGLGLCARASTLGLGLPLRSRHMARFFVGTRTRLRGAGLRGRCGCAPLRSRLTLPLRGWGAPLRGRLTSAPPPIRAGGSGSGSRAWAAARAVRSGFYAWARAPALGLSLPGQALPDTKWDDGRHRFAIGSPRHAQGGHTR